jgi:hypothetical protein
MPTDPSLIPALEEELRQARGTKPGGQESRPERVAAIEEQLKLYRKAAGVPNKRAPKAGEKETAVADTPADNADAKSDKRAENADAASAPETASE